MASIVYYPRSVSLAAINYCAPVVNICRCCHIMVNKRNPENFGVLLCNSSTEIKAETMKVVIMEAVLQGLISQKKLAVTDHQGHAC